MTAAPGSSTRAKPPRPNDAPRGNAALKRVAFGVGGVLLLVALWELYKAVGPAEGVVVGDLTILSTLR